MEVYIVDGAAIVNMLRPGAAKTFSDYAEQPYIISQLQHVSRMDVVWDEYFPESLKAETRSKTGKGVRRRVEPGSAIPGNWQEFLRLDGNKVELFSFLATSVRATDTDKQIISTHHAEVLCTQSRDTSGLAPCTHEEADTRIILHLHDAVKEQGVVTPICAVLRAGTGVTICDRPKTASDRVTVAKIHHDGVTFW